MKTLGVGISLVINTKNEESNIKDCIDSARHYVNEIIVTDMASSDRTREVARGLGARVYKVRDYGFVEPARNYSISKARYPWILILDADERIREHLGEKIKSISKADKYDVVEIPIKNIIFGKWIQHTHWWPNHIPRFFKKGYLTWSNKIHGAPVFRGKVLRLPSTEENAILHNNYENISEFIEKTNRYTTQGIEVFGKKKYSLNEVFDYYEKEFIYRFFDEKGYLDGFHGFFLSKLMEFYRFLEFAKYWERSGYKDVIITSNIKDDVKKHLKDSIQLTEINRLKKVIKQLNEDLMEIQSSKTYKVWQKYCQLRDKLLK